MSKGEETTSSESTLAAQSPKAAPTRLDLSMLPPIFVSSTHLPTEELHSTEEQLIDSKANLTYDVKEARIVLSRASKRARVSLDLRGLGLWSEEVKDDEIGGEHKSPKTPQAVSEAIQAHDLSTASEGDDEPVAGKERSKQNQRSGSVATRVTPPSQRSLHGHSNEGNLIRVVRLEWLEKCMAARKVLPLHEFTTYKCRPAEKPASQSQSQTQLSQPKLLQSVYDMPQSIVRKFSPSRDILQRANEDAPASSRRDGLGKRKIGQTSNKPKSVTTWQAGYKPSPSQPPHLLATTTSEHDAGHTSDLPEPPDWVKQGIKYACERSTPRCNPNKDFIDLLEKIKLARILTNDEIGVRAYATSIASLAAYPYKLSHPNEIVRLPGCDTKIANLFVEFKNDGAIKAVSDIEMDESLQILRLFYNVWGIGATTAREFYFEKGWRDLEDIVDNGWSNLTRVQKIGVKYYDEFLDLIPRAEVDSIGRIVHRHAANITDDGVQSILVGGYRRGKEACGDVDIIVSHPDEARTLNLVNNLVSSLEMEGWITHTLHLSLNGTNRDQQTLPFRNAGGGHGFDTLDKALVVWQDPEWQTKGADLAADPEAKNPNIHRRVDIIVAPWKAVGCAILGWSGGTTFERDLRQYAKSVHRWKFDSSGVRNKVSGEVVDVEDFANNKAKTMKEAERRVFAGLGLRWRCPEERCTG